MNSHADYIKIPIQWNITLFAATKFRGLSPGDKLSSNFGNFYRGNGCLECVLLLSAKWKRLSFTELHEQGESKTTLISCMPVWQIA